MSLAQIGIRGAYFTSIALGLRQIISISTTFYVARQLMPSDIGLFTLVMVVIGIAQVIGDVGIATGLVRSQNNSSIVLSTCFWISGIIGVALLVLIFFTAPFAAEFYSKQEITPYLQVAGIGILINFLLPVPMALLQQRLAYKELALAQATGSLVGALATLTLVFLNFGIWGLVFQPIIGNIALLVMMAGYSKWWPKLEFNFKSAKDILVSGVNLLGSGLIGYIRSTFDTTIIGKNMSAQDLGIYGMAQTILYAPMHLVTSTVSRVIFPLLSMVKDDIEKFQHTVLLATARTALLVFPIYFGLLVLADEFVLYIFGENWLSMVPLVRLMAITFIVQSITNVAGPLMLALNKTSILLKMNAINAVIYFAVLFFLIPFGLTAIAAGYAIINTLFALISLSIALYFSGISYSRYLSAIYRPLFMAFSMGLIVFGIKFCFIALSIYKFLILILIGAGIYLLFIWIFERRALIEVFEAIKNR